MASAGTARASGGPQTRPLSAIVVAATHSGAGKTTVTLGLIGALARKGLRVQPFKVGPDFIDPLHHAHASGRHARNLDGWMLDADANRACFAAATADADVAVIEGVMGLFDGSEGRSDRGSAAEMAKLLGVAVLLVIDASAMARSAAALVHGFASFDPELRIAGVILNRVGGDAHAAIIEEAISDGPPILGALPEARDLVVPERHLGLHLPHEARAGYVARLADLIEAHVDLGRLLDAAQIERAPSASSGGPVRAPGARRHEHALRIGIARDEAFCFYYADNLELLAACGAELVEFSPLRDELPAHLDGLYIGGGYPELHAPALAANTGAIAAIRELAAAGKPIYAECGGLMYLGRRLELDAATHELCGVMPFSTRMPAPLTIAYVEVATTGGPFGAGLSARGHLFHQSEIVDRDERLEHCFELRTVQGERLADGFMLGNTVASYVHTRFASSPALAEAFVARCRETQSVAVPPLAS